ncbi:hypothetical protein H8356DRAFT_1702165 [Neocallimastix lanati (nom. inval.)]|jgi:hypothetical protein|nr:hypothetical protein H8356DRAFT_1702165 [Neocallimastix sp. JGI-2020a]
MVNEFTKASFVAARKLYFEQIATNTNSQVESIINNDGRLKRNSISKENITEENISSTPLEFQSLLHKSTSYSSLIPKKNERSKLFDNNSKIPIPESQSLLNNSVNIHSESSANKQIQRNQKEKAHYATKKSLDKSKPESSPKIQILDEIPVAPPIKPAKISSPLLKHSKSSPHSQITNSKLPMSVSSKNFQNENDTFENMDNSNENNSRQNNNEDAKSNVITEESKGRIVFTKEKAPGWFSLKKEKVDNNNTYSWRSISKTKSEQMEEHKQWSSHVKDDNKLVINNNENNYNRDNINSKDKTKNNTKDNDNIRENLKFKIKEEKINDINSLKNGFKKDEEKKISKVLSQTSVKSLVLAFSERQEATKNQSPSKIPSQIKIIPQERPQTPIRSLSPTELRPQSPAQRPITPTQRPIPTTQIKPLAPAKIQIQSNSYSPSQIRAKTPTYLPSKVNPIVNSQSQSFAYKSDQVKPQIQNEQANNKIELIKEKAENNKNSSTTNEEIVKSPSKKSINKIINNTQNFMYKNNNISVSDQSLNNTTSANTKKLDENVSTATEDDKNINDRKSASTIVFDKKVKQKIDEPISQEKNDNDVLNKFQRKKRTSFGSSSLSRTIDNDENNDENTNNNNNIKIKIIDEESSKTMSESIRDNPMYKYLRSKNDITYQKFNTTPNQYEDDSDASYDSDDFVSSDTENRKESFESKLRKKSKYFINGGKSSIGEKSDNNSSNQNKIAVISKKVSPSLPVPTLPVRKTSTSNMTKKIVQDNVKMNTTMEKYKENVNSKHIESIVPAVSPQMQSVSTSSNQSQGQAASSLSMHNRVNENLDSDKLYRPTSIVNKDPIMIDNKPEIPEGMLKYKPPKRTSSSLNKNNMHTHNKNSQDLTINELTSLVIDAPPERGRSIFKESREFSNKSHSIDTELNRREGNRREGRNRSPDYSMRSGMNEKTRGRIRNNIHSILQDIDDDDDDMNYSKEVNTRKYLKKYLDKREGQRSQSVDASKSKTNSHKRDDSDEYLKIHNDNEDALYISDLLNSDIMDQDNDKENIFFTNKLTPKISTFRQEKYSSIISSNSSISSLSSTSSSASSMTTKTSTTNTADVSKNSSINNKTLVNDTPVDSYYRISGVIKHSVVPIGNPSILYGGDSSYSTRNRNTLYNSRSSITLNRYSYQKSNRSSIQSNKRDSTTSSSTINDDDSSLIFSNLPEEIYNFLKPELEIHAPTRTSSRESIQGSITDYKRQSLSSLHHSLTLNDDSDEVTLKDNSSSLQPSIIKEEEGLSKYMTNDQKRIEQITSEILSTERTYVNELKSLINIYIEPLKKNNLLEQEEYNSIFANIEDIYKFHEKTFLPPLENACRRNEISKFFLDISSSFEIFYSKYYYAFNGANTFLTLIQSSNRRNVRVPTLSSSSYILSLPIFERSNKKRLKKFKSFLKRCAARPDHTQLSLQGYLILPVQRLPRYLLLLEQLVKHSKNNPLKKEEYEKVAELMKNVVASCNSYMKQCEEKHVLLEITTKHIRLDSNKSNGEMVDNYIKIQGLIKIPGAKLIRKGDLQILRSVTSDASIFPCKDIMNKRLSNDYSVGRNPNLINPNIRCSSALSMTTTNTSSSSRTYHDPKNNGSRLSSSNESIHSSSTLNSNYKRSSTSVIDFKKNQTTDSIGMFYLIHNLFIYCKLDGILVNVLDLEDSIVEPASFSSTSSEFVEIESKKTDIVLIISDSKTQLYLTSPDIDSVYSWHQTINKQWKTLKKIEK